jgi:hypothetical protein
MKPTGYVVLESCESYEQVLTLKTGDGLPDGGILAWADKKHMRVIFPTRQAARAAIDRTEHYRLAFGFDLPEKRYCRVEPIAALPAGEGAGQ